MQEIHYKDGFVTREDEDNIEKVVVKKIIPSRKRRRREWPE